MIVYQSENRRESDKNKGLQMKRTEMRNNKLTPETEEYGTKEEDKR